MANILIAHEAPHVRHELLDQLGRAGLNAVVAPTAGSQPLDARDHYDVVVAASRHGQSLHECVGALRVQWPLADFVVITNDGVDDGEGGRDGGVVHLPVGACATHVADAVRRVLDRRGQATLRAPMPIGNATDGMPLDPIMRSIFERADRIARVNSTVLITGESGTGKEVLARRIHNRSGRRASRFVPVNCGSLPDTLIENELFGHRRGSFTGAACDTKGLIEEARGGTLFLDEIGDMPSLLQVRLLRFLDSGEVRAIGDTAVKHLDVRVIAATNQRLDSEIRDGRFRSDLFFRLSVIHFHLPPLRERRADIPALVQALLAQLSSRLNVILPAVSPSAMLVLMRHSWPGNIRELRNWLECGIVQQEGGVIDVEHLPQLLPASGTRLDHSRVHDDPNQLLNALQASKGRVGRAATALGISRSTMWRRLREIDRRAAKALEVSSANAPLAPETQGLQRETFSGCTV